MNRLFLLLVVGLALTAVWLVRGGSPGGESAEEVRGPRAAVDLPAVDPAALEGRGAASEAPTLPEQAEDQLRAPVPASLSTPLEPIPIPPGSIIGRVTYTAAFSSAAPSIDLFASGPGPGEPDKIEVDVEEVWRPTGGRSIGEATWEVPKLAAGEYCVAYAGRAVQRIVVAPGPNVVHADFQDPVAVQLSFVDAHTGEPVEGKRIFAATLVGDELPESFERAIGPFGVVRSPGETHLIDQVFAPALAYKVQADGYASRTGKALAHPGALHFVELEPVFRVRVTLRLSDGTHTDRFTDLGKLHDVRLVIGSNVLPPTRVSSGRAGTFVDFSDAAAQPGAWHLEVPEGLSVLGKPEGAIGPGVIHELELSSP